MKDGFCGVIKLMLNFWFGDGLTQPSPDGGTKGLGAGCGFGLTQPSPIGGTKGLGHGGGLVAGHLVGDQGVDCG